MHLADSVFGIAFEVPASDRFEIDRILGSVVFLVDFRLQFGAGGSYEGIAFLL